MATKSPLRLATTIAHRPPVLSLTPRRTFLNSFLPSDEPLTISVTRTLPYPRPMLYTLIADVDSYSRFLPYCQHSRVTAWSDVDPGARRRWPTEGELTVGFGPVTRSYTSRIVCVPGRSVEALSGREEPAAAAASAASAAHEDRGGNNPFRSLVTRWTVEDAEEEEEGGGGRHDLATKVDLDLRMQFADPLMQVMLSKVADETAAKMIDAFEKRAREMFEPRR